MLHQIKKTIGNDSRNWGVERHDGGDRGRLWTIISYDVDIVGR